MKKTDIIIFGASDDCRAFLKNVKPLKLMGMINIVAIADHDSRIIGTDVEGFEVINPAIISNYNYDFIIVTPIFFLEILEQLKGYGINPDKIVPYYNDYNIRFSREARSFRNVTIGKYSYYKPTTQLWNCDLGSFCHIGENCIIGQVGHEPSKITTYPLKYHFNNLLSDCSKDPTKTRKINDRTIVGNDVYIGENVVITAGVKIGHGVVIGSRSVVTKDVPDFCIAVGVPARVIKKRFSDEIIEALLKIRWWDWPEEKINEQINIFEEDVETFVKLNS